MGAVTTLPWSRALTYADLATMPDDGHRYELLDGTLIVSPAPSPLHQRAVLNLAVLLREATTGSDLETLVAPLDVVLADDTVVEPDVLVARRADLTDRNLPAAPVLAVEVISPSTVRFDRLLKYSRYATAGIAHYWIVDPVEPSLTAYELDSGGKYVELAHVIGDEPFTATRPVNVTVAPAALVASTTPTVD